MINSTFSIKEYIQDAKLSIFIMYKFFHYKGTLLLVKDKVIDSISSFENSCPYVTFIDLEMDYFT